MRERTFERQLIRYCNERRWHCLKLECSSSAGFPDRTVLKPDGETIFMEVKRPHGGVVSEVQKAWITRLRAMGFRAGVVKNMEEAKELLG